jgi:putative heme-binding domain-containing protein
VDAKVGPDGGLYLADWYDTRLSHVRPVDDWHKTSGRIYRVRPASADLRPQGFNLHTAPAEELLAYLRHQNRWFRRQAALEIGWRKLENLAPALRAAVLDRAAPRALDALFALDMLGHADASLVNALLAHPDPSLRRWAVRIVGEKGADWRECVHPLATLARTEEHPEVRAQLLASAKRLPVETALPLLYAALNPMDAAEVRLPLLAWWAMEAHCEFSHVRVLEFLRDAADFAASELFATHLAGRLGQRLAAGNDAGRLDSAMAVFDALQEPRARQAFVEGVGTALEGAHPARLSGALSHAVREFLVSRDGGPVVADLRAGKAEALGPALRLLADPKAATGERISVSRALAEGDWPAAVPALLAVVSHAGSSAALKRAALLAVSRYPQADVPAAVLSAYESRIAGEVSLRETALRVLAGRLKWAEVLVQAIEEDKVPLKHVSPELVSLLVQHRGGSVAVEGALQRHWRGVAGGLSPAEKLKEAGRLREALRAGGGSHEEGRRFFTQLCATCHKLFEAGNVVGPELTGYERGSVDFWVDNIVYPSMEIREGFGAYTARTRTGQVFFGMLESESGTEVVLRDLSGQKTRFRREEIANLEASPLSIMPEGLLSGLSDQQVRDLFAYLMRPAAESAPAR